MENDRSQPGLHAGPQTDDRAIVVSLDFGGFDNAEDIHEITQLTISAGFKVSELIKSKRSSPHTKYFIGSGKIEEIVLIKESIKAKILIFNHELTPSQERNIEKITGMRVFDRTALILFIFSLRAKTYEGKLQVELAHLTHLSTRLVKGWSHLERQKGGIGVRGGPGEKQIELDRRMLGLRIKQLKEKLKKLAQQRSMQRRARKRSQALSISIVGYTNAGKSTLFNYLTHESILSEDKLFATLDTTSRKLFIEPGHSVVISDTVGFIKNLPTTLIEAFKSTLEEVTDSDLLVHVVDISNENKAQQIKEVEKILREINAHELPHILVLNQIDKINLKTSCDRDAYGKINHIQLSAKTGNGIELLKQAMVEQNQILINQRNGNYA